MATTRKGKRLLPKVCWSLAHLLKHNVFVAEQPAAENVTFPLEVVKYWDQ